MKRVILLAAMLLSGCWWVGAPFYTPTPDAPSPIASGRYRLDRYDDDDRPMASFGRIDRTPKGDFAFSEDGDRALDDERMTVSPLGPNLWVTQLLDKPTAAVATYGLLRRTADNGLDLWAVIDCSSTKDIAVAAGATISADDGNPTCTFPSRAALETALLALARSDHARRRQIHLTRLAG